MLYFILIAIFGAASAALVTYLVFHNHQPQSIRQDLADAALLVLSWSSAIAACAIFAY